MTMKDMWIDSFEELAAEYEEQGLSRKEAEKRAEDEAYDHAYERACGQADYLRKAAKENP